MPSTQWWFQKHSWLVSHFSGSLGSLGPGFLGPLVERLRMLRFAVVVLDGLIDVTGVVRGVESWAVVVRRKMEMVGTEDG